MVNIDRVEMLKKTFLLGLYKHSILADPSVRYVHGVPKLGLDGKTLLDDGICTIVALMECLQLYTNPEPNEEAPTFSDALVTVFNNGVEVNILNYLDDDPDDCFLHQASRHDEEANRFAPTGISDYVDAAKRYNKKVPGHVAQRHYKCKQLSFCI